MNLPIAKLLQDNDPMRRREGVLRAVQSGDPHYIDVLEAQYRSEPDANLRVLIQKGIARLESAAPCPPIDPAPVRPPASEQAPAQADTSRTTARPSNTKNGAGRTGRLLPFLAFTVVVIGIGALIVWQVAGATLQRMLWQQQFSERLTHAPALPGTPLAANQGLNGQVYNTKVSALTSYVVVEPNASPEPGGWPVLLVLHGWMGNGLGEIPNYTAQAACAGVILVVPTFDHASNPTYEAVYHDLRTIRTQLNARYRVNWQSSVIAGFSWGGRVTQFYSVVYVKDFGGAVVGGSREYMPVPGNSSVRYAVFVGTADFYDDVNRSQLAHTFVDSMAKAGKPVWYFENSPNVGHQLVQTQVDKTFELIAELRSRR